MIDHLQYNRQKYYPAPNENFISIPKQVKVPTNAIASNWDNIDEQSGRAANGWFTADAVCNVIGATDECYKVESVNDTALPIDGLIGSNSIIWVVRSKVTPIN